MKTGKTFNLIISGLLILFFTTTTWAKDPIQGRQYNQRHQIKNGIQSGSITKHEFSQLKKEQLQIRKFTHSAARDGRITQRERRAIAQMQDRAGRHIHRAKENRHHRDHHNHRGHAGYHNYGYYGPGSCGRPCLGCYNRGGAFVNGFYFSSTWFEPSGFFSFSTGSRW